MGWRRERILGLGLKGFFFIGLGLKGDCAGGEMGDGAGREMGCCERILGLALKGFSFLFLVMIGLGLKGSIWGVMDLGVKWGRIVISKGLGVRFLNFATIQILSQNIVKISPRHQLCRP